MPDEDEFTTRDLRTLLGIITETEFGRAIGVVGPTIADWRNQGYGPPYYQHRRNIYYRTADVVQWLIDNTVDPKTGTYIVPREASEPAAPPVRRKRRAPRAAIASPENVQAGDGRAQAASPTGSNSSPPNSGSELNSGELRSDGTRVPSQPTTKSKHPQVELSDESEDPAPSAV